MDTFISLALRNATLTLYILTLIIVAVSLIFKSKPLHKALVIEVFISYFVLLNIGVSYLYNFVMHVFYGDMVAQFIGWAQSPFQLEVGFASLGFAALGFIGFRGNLSFRAAAIISTAFFLLGAAGGHIYQMIVADNFAPGNAGVVFWTDILTPIFGFILLYLQKKYPLQPGADLQNTSET